MVKNEQISVGLVGGTGYTGSELIRLLLGHKHIRLTHVFSRSEAGKRIADLLPNLEGLTNLVFQDLTAAALKGFDLVVFCTPNGVCMNYATELAKSDTRILDLSADFRIKDIQTWQHWYSLKHNCPALVEKAVYGLAELGVREQISNAKIVANPGCYATSMLLAIYPLLKNKIKINNIFIDGKSGFSGAGRQSATKLLKSEGDENLTAYQTSGHRHKPEVIEVLQRVCGESPKLSFVPHLIPMTRGILSSVYCDLNNDENMGELHTMYQKCYLDEHFVIVLPEGKSPATKSVRGSNFCKLGLAKQNSNQLIVFSAIDNLVKGAAGQAVQNINIMFGFSEQEGLTQIALYP